MRHGSLFSGIGGFDLAAEWMGWENVFHCEWNPFGQRILKHYWPNAERLRLQHGEETRNLQDSARKTQTKGCEFAKSIETNGEHGHVTDTRLEGLQGGEFNGAFNRAKRNDNESHDTTTELYKISHGNALHPDNERLQGRAHEGNAGEKGQGKKQFTTRSIRPNWDIFPTQSPICGRNDGLPTELDGITFPKWRNESIKAYGNAIVPQVVYEILKAIEKYENL